MTCAGQNSTIIRREGDLDILDMSKYLHQDVIRREGGLESEVFHEALKARIIRREGGFEIWSPFGE